MNFLDKNGFRAALVIAVLFVSMPFMFPERVPINDKGVAEGSSQPVKSKKFLTGVYDRIGSFYGFKKTKKSALDQTLEQLKKEADGAAADKKAAEETTQKSFEKAAEAAASSSSGSDEGGGSFDTGSSSSKMSFSAAAAKAAAKPKLSFGGKEYEVAQDLYGNDYAITEKGPVPAKSLLAKGGVLKYPSGKRVSGSRVSSEAYNPGGGANPYSSLTASSKSSGGSYKAGKRSGGVASTRKISSGFSLSGGGSSGGGKVVRRSSGARGYSGGEFTGAVDIEDAYNNVQAQASAVKTMQNTNSSEDQIEYYDVASPMAAPKTEAAAAPAIAPELLQGPSMFDGAVFASAQGTKEQEKSVTSAPTTIDLGLDDSPAPEAKTDNQEQLKPEDKEKEVTVNIKVNQGTNIIPTDRNVLQDMTDKLLGKEVVFESSDGKIKNPWLFPTSVAADKNGKKEFSVAFWDANKEALAKAKKDEEGSSYSDQTTWGKPDKEINKNVIPYVRGVKTPYKVIVVDGAATGSEKNYFQQMANYITGNTPEARGAKAIYVFKNEYDMKTEEDKIVARFKHPLTITPENNKKFAIEIQDQVKAMEKKKNANTSSNTAVIKQSETNNEAKNLSTQVSTVNILGPKPERPIR